jgi:hypothetical protein
LSVSTNNIAMSSSPADSGRKPIIDSLGLEADEVGIVDKDNGILTRKAQTKRLILLTNPADFASYAQVEDNREDVI